MKKRAINRREHWLSATERVLGHIYEFLSRTTRAHQMLADKLSPNYTAQKFSSFVCTAWVSEFTRIAPMFNNVSNKILLRFIGRHLFSRNSAYFTHEEDTRVHNWGVHIQCAGKNYGAQRIYNYYHYLREFEHIFRYLCFVIAKWLTYSSIHSLILYALIFDE